MSVKCNTEVQLERGELFCTTCSRYYELYKLIHICNDILPCARPPQDRFVEKYLSMADAESITNCTVVECEECESARLQLTAPTKDICAKCEYVGWFVVKSHGLCPACEAESAPKPKKEPKKTREKAERIIQSAKPIADLVVQSVDYNRCTIVVSLITRDDVMNGIVTSLTNFNVIRDDEESALMEKFREFLVRKSENYEIRWVIPDPYAKYALLHLHNKHIPDVDLLGLGF